MKQLLFQEHVGLTLALHYSCVTFQIVKPFCPIVFKAVGSCTCFKVVHSLMFFSFSFHCFPLYIHLSNSPRCFLRINFPKDYWSPEKHLGISMLSANRGLEGSCRERWDQAEKFPEMLLRKRLNTLGEWAAAHSYYHNQTILFRLKFLMMKFQLNNSHIV